MKNITSSDLRYFRLAKNASENSDFKQHHIGCLAVYHHKILDVSWNTNRTSPHQKQANQFRILNGNNITHKCHAEIELLNKLQRFHNLDFSKINIYLYRERNDGELALSRPCNGCYEALRKFGVKNIYYSTYGGFKYEEIL